MRQWWRGTKGFSLIEVIIVIALLAVLAGVVVPNVVRYVSGGKKSAYDSEVSIIQVAVRAYYADSQNMVEGIRRLPIKGGTGVDRSSGGTPIATTWTDANSNGVRDSGEEVDWTSGGKDTSGYFIDFEALVNGKYLPEIPASASADNETGLTGHYGWYVDANDKVGSIYYDDPGKSGFQTGVYP